MKITWLFISLFAIGCPSSQSTPTIHTPDDTSSCSAACQHLSDLKCPEASPLGTTCTQFCQDSQNSGHALQPSCVVNIKTCDDMNNLDVFCPKK